MSVALRPGLVLLAAVLLRAGGLGAESFWTDEFASLLSSDGYALGDYWPPPGPASMQAIGHTRLQDARPIWTIPGALRSDNHPPLYYVLLRLWRVAFGESEAAVRSLSVVASLLSILVLFDSVRVLAGTTPALWAAALLTLAAPDVHFAREGRPYTLLILLLLIGVSALVRLERFGPSRLWATILGAAAAGAFLTHYYAAGFLAGLFVHASIRLNGSARRHAIGAFLAAALVVMIAWGPMLSTQVALIVRTDGWDAWNLCDPSCRPALVGRLLRLPVSVLFTAHNVVGPRSVWVGLSWLVAAVIVWRRRALWIFAWGAAGAIALVCMIDLVRDSRQLDYPRYLLAATPAACALLASLVSPPRGREATARSGHAVLVMLALVLAAWMPRVYTPGRPQWRDLMSRVHELVPPSQLLVLWQGSAASSADVMAFDFYMPRDERRLFVLRPAPSDADVSALNQAGEYFVLAFEEHDPKLLPGRSDCVLCRPSFPPLFLWHVNR